MTKRIPFLLVAVALHALLPLTVWFLFPFLGGYTEPVTEEANPAWWGIDLLLALQFCTLHSLFLYREVRDRLEAWIPRPLYGCFFMAMTCLSLLLLLLAWQASPHVVYRLDGLPSACVRWAYFLSWVGLAYSISLTGFGYQTGWTPIWTWFRSQDMRRRFEPKGAYNLLRHPVYLAFLCQVWLTPILSLDRAILNLILTGYIFLGSYFKDQRLLYYLGDAYREYQSRVPGYPLLGFGPLGRVSRQEHVEQLADAKRRLPVG